MVAFEDLLARADEETLSELLGRSSVRVLLSMAPELARPSNLRKLVEQLHAPDQLLGNRTTRSTLLMLLRPAEAEALCVELGLSVDGPAAAYEALSGLRLKGGSESESRLFERFGVAREEHGEYDAAPPETRTVEPNYGLFDHQRDAVYRLHKCLAPPPHRTVLHMPTGAGKTRTAMNLIVEELRASQPSLVIWLAYSEELCEQTAAEFERAWSHLGNRPLAVHRYWGSRDLALGQIRDGFLVAGLAKMYSAARRERNFLATLGDRTQLVLIDEAHQAVAETYRTVLEQLVERDNTTRLVGLTATPGRTWSDVDEDEKLSAFFGRSKVRLEVDGYDNPVDYLVACGYLADATTKPLLSHSGLDLTKGDLAQLERAIDVPRDVLDRLASDDQRNLLIVSRLEELTERHRRILVFATTVEHAEMLAVVLKSRGIAADVVTGQTPKGPREQRISWFKDDSSSAKILCNYGVLTTGFDAPRTSAALIARPTNSLVLYSQMVGRATRGPRAGGNATAEIVTVVDTALPGFGDMTEAFVNWEDVWDDN